MADMRVLRELLKRRQRLDQDIWNVAKSMLVAGLKVQYTLSDREYFGRVIEMVGVPSALRVRVENLTTLKRRDIALADITGIVSE